MDLDEHSTTKPHPQPPAISSANRKLHTPSQGAIWGHCAITRVLFPLFHQSARVPCSIMARGS